MHVEFLSWRLFRFENDWKREFCKSYLWL